MHKVAPALALLATLFSSACQAETRADEKTQQTGAAADRSPAAPAKDASPPSPEQALRDIYGIAASVKPGGSDPVRFDLGGGKDADWWFGHRYEFEGKQYFTVVAALAPRSDPNDELGMGPISQATYLLDGGGWKKIDSDRFIGQQWQSPTSTKPARLDKRRKVLSHVTHDGRLLLAVPTRSLLDGVDYSGYELFLGDPEKRVKPLRKGMWAYVGYVETGENNAADCGPAGKRCYGFEASSVDISPQDELPWIIVHFTGTTSGGYAITFDDIVEYSFDQARKEYLVTERSFETQPLGD